MPSARLLALAPAPGQQLFLRGASATAATGGGSGSGGNNDSRLAHRHGASLRTARSGAGGWCRCASTMPIPAFPLALALHARPTARRPIPTGVASFGSATLPKQVAFPRHGKAVEPLTIDEQGREKQPHSAKNGKRATRKTSRRGKNGTLASSGSSKVKGDAAAATVADAVAETAPTPSAPAEAEAEVEAEADTAIDEAETLLAEATEAAKNEAAAEEEAEDEAEAEAAEAEAVTQSFPTPTGPDRAGLVDGPPSVATDAQKELGREIKDSAFKDATPPPPSPLAYSEKVVGLAADAAAAAASAATAAEPESVAAGIVNNSLVIELGPPNPGMGAISGPGESGSASNQQERIALPASLRQPLSQKPPPPHLVPPPYVHHFDSYSLVRQLESGGYKQAQAITAMKGVRLLLAQNLDMAQTSLVSKSDVENEAYLFKAACAELSIEVQNNRRRADEQIRQQRTLLQSEVDIAAQSVNQELVALNDVVKGLFNDRKMAVREEQRTHESAVQQLNYKITIMLNSEMRSEIEALRWVLIRRSVLGIIFMVMLTLGSLRYVSYVSHEKKKQAEQAVRQVREAEMQRYADSKIDSSSPPDAAEILAAN